MLPQSSSHLSLASKTARTDARAPLRVITILRGIPGAVPMPLPLFASRVPAGFPSPADDYVDQRLDLNTHLVEHPAATFFTRVSGHSMRGAGIHDGDLLIVDRALEPQDGRIVIAAVNGELTVKRLRLRSSGAWLVPEHPDYKPLKITEGLDCVIWGVVTRVIHAV
jgi:DNA polymerase V